MKRYLARRALWTAFAAYLVLSLVFLGLALGPDPDRLEGQAKFQGGSNAYQMAQNENVPLLDRYLDFTTRFVTLDVEQSMSMTLQHGTLKSSQQVNTNFVTALGVTLAYLFPALLVAILVGGALGLYAAMNQGSLSGRFTSVVTYVGVGVPSYWSAVWVTILLFERTDMWKGYGYKPAAEPWSPVNLPYMAFPFVIVLFGMIAVQARYTRSEAAEHVHAEFVRTLRANGAKSANVARHVIRNAAMPLISLFFVRTITMLFVTVIVAEYVFGIPGIGHVAFTAIRNRQLDLILLTTMVPVVVVLVGNLVQDVAYAVLDPRVELGE